MEFIVDDVTEATSRLLCAAWRDNYSIPHCLLPATRAHTSRCVGARGARTFVTRSRLFMTQPPKSLQRWDFPGVSFQYVSRSAASTDYASGRCLMHRSTETSWQPRRQLR
jgi:hypothetical protein